MPGLPPVVVGHTFGSPEFYWAVVAELSLLVWTALLFPAARGSGAIVGGWRFRLAALGAGLSSSLVALAGKTLEVWPGNPLFPSGHTAYVVAIAVLLVGRDRRWLPVVVTLWAVMAVALLLANYHVGEDIAGGVAVGAAVGGFVLARLRLTRPAAAG